MVEVSLTVGKLDASLALLLTKDHHLIEFPTILLPNGVKAGSIVKIKCEQDFDTEQEEAKQFKSIQDEILNTFGKNLPVNPVLKIKNITQTSCVLEWDELNLGTSSLKNLFLFKDGKKLGSIPQPLVNRTTKLSGLPIDKTFEFQLKLDTTAGIYESEILEVTTHKMTDLSGINICLGDISANEVFTVQDIEDTLKNMGAHYPSQSKVSVDTTHFICTRENKSNPEFIKASDMNIPIIRPEWLKACEKDKRIVGVRDYYTKDCVLPDILAKDFWHKNKSSSTPIATPVNDNDKPVPELPVEESVGHAVPTINEPVDTVPEQSAVVENAEPEADTDTEPVGDSTDAIPISSDKIPAKDEVAPEIHEIKIDEPSGSEDAKPLEVEAPTDTPQPASTILETQPEPEHQPQLSQDEAPEPKVVDDKEPKETLHEINLDTPTEPEPVSEQPKVAETTGGNSEEKEDVTEEAAAEAEGEAEDEGEGEETDKETDKVDKPTSKKSKKKKNKKKKN